MTNNVAEDQTRVSFVPTPAKHHTSFVEAIGPARVMRETPDANRDRIEMRWIPSHIKSFIRSSWVSSM